MASVKTKEEPRKFSSTQVNLPEHLAKHARAFAAKIPDGDLAEDGRENEPHVTVRWGLHSDDAKEAAKHIAGHGPIKARIKHVSIFPGAGDGKYDVVKAGVESDDLRKLNAKLGEKMENTQTHPTYNPHVTLAYVKPGLGRKHVGKIIPGLSGKTITLDHVMFLPHDGEKTKIPLTGKPSAKVESATEGRRITGSADIPLSADGKEQSRDFASKMSEKFDYVLSSPEKRALQTAKAFGVPIPLEGLDAWRRGMYEGKSVETTKGAIRHLMLHPSIKALGKSPFSKEDGESLDEFSKPLLSTVQAILALAQTKERVLIVTHGGNLQTVDAWLREGSKEDLSFDNKEMAQTPYWSVTGKLFFMSPKGLKEVDDNDAEGCYATEHSATDFNPGT